MVSRRTILLVAASIAAVLLSASAIAHLLVSDDESSLSAWVVEWKDFDLTKYLTTESAEDEHPMEQGGSGATKDTGPYSSALGGGKFT